MAKEEEGRRLAPSASQEGRRLAPSASKEGRRWGAGQAPLTGGPPFRQQEGPPVRPPDWRPPPPASPLAWHLRRFAIGLDARALPRRSCPRGLRRGGYPRRHAPHKPYK
ncbi:hypothetical protein Taro_031196 [Colocasia esculenta]|uniref:Uncharacterized protein n=1 Tax=Colocasia esculenta TaxID=4460 RepID=A0A843VW19_COLES|nr:hypothetical protein [Colocasia esculenta]